MGQIEEAVGLPQGVLTKYWGLGMEGIKRPVGMSAHVLERYEVEDIVGAEEPLPSKERRRWNMWGMLGF